MPERGRKYAPFSGIFKAFSNQPCILLLWCASSSPLSSKRRHYLYSAWRHHWLFSVYIYSNYKQQLDLQWTFLKCLPWYRNTESQWTLSMIYFTTASHVAGDNFVFQQDTALVNHACNTVILLACELSTSLLSTMDLPLAARQRTTLI